jgi:hypothetical protein
MQQNCASKHRYQNSNLALVIMKTQGSEISLRLPVSLSLFHIHTQANTHKLASVHPKLEPTKGFLTVPSRDHSTASCCVLEEKMAVAEVLGGRPN